MSALYIKKLYHSILIPVRIRHLTPTSSLWLQGLEFSEVQSISVVSVPAHLMKLNAIGPDPRPKLELVDEEERA